MRTSALVSSKGGAFRGVMRILLLNQYFYPDIAATAQHAGDLAAALSEDGRQVTALTSNAAYAQTGLRYEPDAQWRGVRIIRAPSVNFGKQARWRRALNFGSFAISCAWRLLRLPRHDAVIAMTTPPLIAWLGALFTSLKGGSLHVWVMDLNPDQAIAAGWVREGGLTARLLEAINRYTLRQAKSVVALDRFMKARIVAKGVDADRILIVPPGSRDHVIHYDDEGRRQFRERHGLAAKFVVMYSGNHSPCHPLDTLLQAAERLRSEANIAFCFVGGGTLFDGVARFAQDRGLSNIITLPYQPEEALSASLSAADLHAVVVGEPFVGIIHPSKIYNVLALGIPVLYIGPAESHIKDVACSDAGGEWLFESRHGDVAGAAEKILLASREARNGSQAELAAAKRFSHQATIDQLRIAFSNGGEHERK